MSKLRVPPIECFDSAITGWLRMGASEMEILANLPIDAMYYHNIDLAYITEVFRYMRTGVKIKIA